MEFWLYTCYTDGKMDFYPLEPLKLFCSRSRSFGDASLTIEFVYWLLITSFACVFAICSQISQLLSGILLIDCQSLDVTVNINSSIFSSVLLSSCSYFCHPLLTFVLFDVSSFPPSLPLSLFLSLSRVLFMSNGRGRHTWARERPFGAIDSIFRLLSLSLSPSPSASLHLWSSIRS